MKREVRCENCGKPIYFSRTYMTWFHRATLSRFCRILTGMAAPEKRTK